MSARQSPRRIGAAIEAVRAGSEPATLLGAVQGVWAAAAGDAIAAEAEPVAERDGVVKVACRSATWAQELDLLQDQLLERVEVALRDRDQEPVEPPLRGLRFTADGARHFCA
jgi:predicted nucleic acid-binding Zn ribbon protein